MVVSHSTGPLSDADTANLEILKATLGDRLIGEVPPGAEAASVDPRAAGLEVVHALKGRSQT